MDSTVLVILVILVVVALAVVAYVVLKGNQRREAARTQAHELRSDPVASGTGVHEANLEAQRAQEEAERLRREAEEAERRASHAEQGVTVEQARQEDVLREADRVDPDVNPRSDDYDPTSPVAGPEAPATEHEQMRTAETPTTETPNTQSQPPR